MDPCEANFPGLENLEEDLKGWQWTFAKSPKFTLISGAQEVRLFHLNYLLHLLHLIHLFCMIHLCLKIHLCFMNHLLHLIHVISSDAPDSPDAPDSYFILFTRSKWLVGRWLLLGMCSKKGCRISLDTCLMLNLPTCLREVIRREYWPLI